MSNILEYKGYYTKVEYSAEDNILFGKIEGINDLVTFEEENPKLVEQAFHEAVDDYLIFCEDIGQEPDKVYKGTFNVRIAPELHRKLALISFANGESLNQSVEKAIENYVQPSNQAVAKVCESIAQATLTLTEMQNSWAKPKVAAGAKNNSMTFNRQFAFIGSN